NLIQQVSAEDFTVDGLGNRQRTARPASRDYAHKDYNRVRRFGYDVGGRLEETLDSVAVPGDSIYYNYTRAQTFDGSGNVQSRDEYETDSFNSFTRNDHLYAYYSADDRLT